MVSSFIILVFVLLAVIAGLLHRVTEIDKERKALLDRLLVANSIMPLADPPPAAKKDVAVAQKIKFKLFP